MFIPKLVRPLFTFMTAAWQPMYWIQLAGLALSAVGTASSMSSARGASKSANAAAYRSELDGARQEARIGIEAQYEVQRAREEATRIKQQAVIKRGAQVAQMAASGVVVGNGSSQAMIDETIRLANQDAIAVMMDGARGFTVDTTRASDAREKAQSQAAAYAAQGKSLLSQGMSNAFQSAGKIATTTDWGAVKSDWANLTK